MKKNNISDVFEMIEFNDLEDLEKIVNENNVNFFVNEFGQNLLHEAITQDKPEIFNYLLYCNIDNNKLDREGKTPLHYSTAHNNYNLTKLLLESNGIEKGIKDQHGNNPMWVAVFNSRGHYDIVKLLMEHGIDAQSKNTSGRSALDFARQIKDEELVQILLG
ncbi:Ankyrin repeat-containing protein [Chryseobacterium carnipullorum]|uniref:ankyrin repeat domain-containing protein n=1 Tax=Chryseobacterium carnipullorum TaxID=1124835 RepID=UPI000914F77E|nr:ankyrin repeat domain-containing protein [Chryseobacterium carnipullorum]SHM45196.1 Ankyrin repeat-containing protein [Chryseobacterium carnipullorum]